MDYLRQGIHLRGYAQKDPKQEYKKEAFELFTKMLHTMRYEITCALITVEIQTDQDATWIETQRKQYAEQAQQFIHPQLIDELSEPQKNVNSILKKKPAKVGRNANCPCGSQKKYKHCHGKSPNFKQQF